MEAAVTPAVIEEARSRQRRRRLALGIPLVAVVTAAAIIGPLHPWGSSTRARVAGKGGAQETAAQTLPMTPGHGPHVYTYSQAVAAGIIAPIDIKRYVARSGMPLCPRDPRAHTKGECIIDPRQDQTMAGASQTFPPMHLAAVWTAALRYVDASGWSVVYPRRFHSRAFNVQWSGSSAVGASFSNFGPAPSPGDVWDGRPPRVPIDGVLFELTQSSGDLAPLEEPREAGFPISLSQFVRRPWSSSKSVRHVEYSFQADGDPYLAEVWEGTRAPSADRRAIAAIVRSIRFPKLRPGERVGPYVVLDRVGAYPVGTVLRFGRSTFPSFAKPFYLVRDSSGFRAVGWPANMYPPYHKAPCDVQFDRRRSQFFCPYIARWDFQGRVVVSPPGMSQPAPLYDYGTTISWDGHLLVSEDEMSQGR